MDETPVLVQHPENAGYASDGHFSGGSNINSAPVPKSAGGQVGVKSKQTIRNMPHSLAAKATVGRKLKLNAGPAKKGTKRKTSSDRSPIKKRAVASQRKTSRKSSQKAGPKKQKGKTAARSTKKK